APPSSPVALRLPGLQTRSPEKVRSTASGESRCHSNVNERLSRKTGPFVVRRAAISPVALRLPGLQKP
ncbi:hypothetical protein RFI23_002821, partial [Klebsiella aerogenes]|nr:hypothetical protein [Klebsiella aerogenes]